MTRHGSYTRSLSVEASCTDGHAELAVIGDLTADTRQTLLSMLDMVPSKQPRELVINFRYLRRADSASLHMIAGPLT